MFALEIQTEFCAAHALVIQGQREPIHGHNWHITATIAGDQLDADGLLVDFHEVERALVQITSPFHNQNLNEAPPFDTLNPTAEHIAQHIGQQLAKALPENVCVRSVRVTEAPNCAALWSNSTRN